MSKGIGIGGDAMKRENQGVLFPEMEASFFSGDKEKTCHPGWGGARKGAGKKKKRWREGAPHRRRVTPRRWISHHVTLSLKTERPTRRSPAKGPAGLRPAWRGPSGVPPCPKPTLFWFLESVFLIRKPRLPPEIQADQGQEPRAGRDQGEDRPRAGLRPFNVPASSPTGRS